MNQEDIELRLLANLPIPLDGAGFVNIPSFRTVVETGLSAYNSCLAYLLIDKDSLQNPVHPSVSNFDIFFTNCYHSEEFRNAAFAALKLFFRYNTELISNQEEFYIQVGEKLRLDNSNFELFQKIVQLANNIKITKGPEYKPGNSKAQEMINMILKNRKKQPKPKDKIDLVSMVSALAWKQNGINIFNVFDLNIFQIYNAFHVTNNIDNYHHTVTAIYAGTIDGKNIKMSDIHWANKIQEE
ncbi:hypothetical protein [Paenibacillus sp. ISL-20]|uniref:hypothetical protein n=1 Tax=Paenibacillus sp. ISL-20 TaxID=2819163 RepID=UPI001BE94A6E|nr:hypothetical protein [Paenibacillus sp. ISL-20]MBT2759850.1 hypothetical protein [Paenibacillus sp. ISL-20]